MPTHYITDDEGTRTSTAIIKEVIFLSMEVNNTVSVQMLWTVNARDARLYLHNAKILLLASSFF